MVGMEMLGQALASPVLLAAGSLEKTVYAATTTVERKLISSVNANTL
jgi:hypothetical protein